MKWLIFLIFLVSCIEAPVTDFASTSDDEGRDTLRGRIRSRSLSDSSARCSESKSCKNTCEDIYLKATDLDRCYNTSESKVKAVSEVFDILINPEKLSNLNDIDAKDFSQFLSIGYRAFLDLIDPVFRDEDGDRRNVYWEDLHAYDARSAQLVLEWIANEEKATRSIASKDKDLDIVRHLFCIAGRSVSVSKQKDYMCDLWDLSDSDCNSELPDENREKTWTVSNDVDDPWTMTVKDSSDEEDCHNNPASLYIGLTQGEYDGVAFSTYAKKQENDQAQNLSQKLIDKICSGSSLCNEFYTCSVEIAHEGLPQDDANCLRYRDVLP